MLHPGKVNRRSRALALIGPQKSRATLAIDGPRRKRGLVD
jgi:hypothetical protein